MRFFSKKQLLLVCSLAFLLIVISACGNDSNDTSSENSDETKGSEVTIEGKKGEVTIPADVERIIAPYHEDALLALGVTPVAKWSIGKSVQDYLEPQLKDVPRIEWNLPQEQVLEHNPDLLVLGSDLASYEGSYEDYQKIAPTYVMPEDVSNNWRKQIEVFGKMLGKEDKADEVLAAYEEKVAKAKEKLSNSIGDESIAMIWVAGDQFYLLEKDRHSAEVVYSELGINVPPFVESLGKSKVAWNPISMEKLSELKADHVFLLALEGEQGLETLEKSAVWQSIPAAEKDQVYVMNDPSFWTNKGLIASQKTIDALVDTLVK
ncbi:iron-hydroxamate ABC transporter substrate-binding protein [Virgibacillus necropolis]|uniref:Ferrichrome ABC transporter substrate-binding protein n=1 Tax=Virgibacillus necropolis TaxID=163877 RepID=A0A221MFV0_9BACI|nr:iron-hydroxamate ABC transporter substrate-binding protein [Virgibacillus necropolis]ASN06546.1 ferrichrome ABC transporter substrate-binding protein [Virgibacillus necropolis]